MSVEQTSSGICMSLILDELDKKLLHEMGSGIYSYDQLARICKVTRNTIYRRVKKLEDAHFIARKVMAIPDLGRMGLSAICIGMDCATKDTDNVIEKIRQLPDTKSLWRTYGDHQIVLVMVCEKGCEGGAIDKLKLSLMEYDVGKMHISIGYAWEKMDFSPF
jgi:DNA-binding Lrp family transcriptional regulator